MRYRNRSMAEIGDFTVLFGGQPVRTIGSRRSRGTLFAGFNTQVRVEQRVNKLTTRQLPNPLGSISIVLYISD